MIKEELYNKKQPQIAQTKEDPFDSYRQTVKRVKAKLDPNYAAMQGLSDTYHKIKAQQQPQTQMQADLQAQRFSEGNLSPQELFPKGSLTPKATTQKQSATPISDAITDTNATGVNPLNTFENGVNVLGNSAISQGQSPYKAQTTQPLTQPTTQATQPTTQQTTPTTNPTNTPTTTETEVTDTGVYDFDGNPVAENNDLYKWYKGLNNIVSRYGNSEEEFLNYGNSIKNVGNTKEYEQWQADRNVYDSIKNSMQAYAETKAKNEQAVREAQEYASVRERLMSKYINDTLDAKGVSNTGAAESTLLQSKANYDNIVANAKQNGASANTLSYQDLVNKITASYEEQKAEQDAVYADKLSLYEGYKSAIEKGNSTEYPVTEEGLKDSLEAGDIDQDMYDDLIDKYNEKYGIGSWERGVTVDNNTYNNSAKYVDSKKNLVGHTFKMTGDNFDLSVQSTDSIIDAMNKAGFTGTWGKGSDENVKSFVTKAKNGEVSNGTMFDADLGMGHQLYVYYDGKLYRIKE